MKVKFKNQVRMIIVDEVSMMSPSEFTQLNKRLNYLMDQPSAKYGNLSISFMGGESPILSSINSSIFFFRIVFLSRDEILQLIIVDQLIAYRCFSAGNAGFHCV